MCVRQSFKLGEKEVYTGDRRAYSSGGDDFESTFSTVVQSRLRCRGREQENVDENKGISGKRSLVCPGSRGQLLGG